MFRHRGEWWEANPLRTQIWRKPRTSFIQVRLCICATIETATDGLSLMNSDVSIFGIPHIQHQTEPEVTGAHASVSEFDAHERRNRKNSAS